MDDNNAATLYDKVGGTAALRIAVDRFYDRVLTDERLAHYFEGINETELRRHQVLFLGQALGGPKQYDGRDLAIAHAGLSITSKDYDLVVSYLVGVLTELHVSADVLDALSAAVASLKPSIVDDGSAVKA